MSGTRNQTPPANRAMTAILAVWLVAGHASTGIAQENQKEAALAVPVEVLAVVSGGLWQGKKEDDSGENANAEQPADKDGRGYYRAIAVRTADNTSRLYFQKIDLSSGKPVILDTVAIEELETKSAYITDMRPENSTGVADNEGFAAYVYLKEDPKVVEPDTWELYIDEFGEHEFLPASN